MTKKCFFATWALGTCWGAYSAHKPLCWWIEGSLPSPQKPKPRSWPIWPQFMASNRPSQLQFLAKPMVLSWAMLNRPTKFRQNALMTFSVL